MDIFNQQNINIVLKLLKDESKFNTILKEKLNKLTNYQKSQIIHKCELKIEKNNTYIKKTLKKNEIQNLFNLLIYIEILV